MSSHDGIQYFISDPSSQGKGMTIKLLMQQCLKKYIIFILDTSTKSFHGKKQDLHTILELVEKHENFTYVYKL